MCFKVFSCRGLSLSGLGLIQRLFSEAVVNESYLISFSGCLFLVCTDLCILILLPAILLKAIISFKNFVVKPLETLRRIIMT